jgi:hypothetical protein
LFLFGWRVTLLIKITQNLNPSLFGFIFYFSDGAKANHQKKKVAGGIATTQPPSPHPKSIYWKMDQFVIRLISN